MKKIHRYMTMHVSRQLLSKACQKHFTLLVFVSSETPSQAVQTLYNSLHCRAMKGFNRILLEAVSAKISQLRWQVPSNHTAVCTMSRAGLIA